MSQNPVFVEKVAAFTDGETGGNPAGVAIADVLPGDDIMQRVATVVGASETVFAAPLGSEWRVRYFSPESEVPFCGHATIALAAVLGESHGLRDYVLRLNQSTIQSFDRAAGVAGGPCKDEL